MSYFSLNATGAWIWQNAASYSSEVDLVRATIENCQLDAEDYGDVRAFCNSLIDGGLMSQDY